MEICLYLQRMKFIQICLPRAIFTFSPWRFIFVASEIPPRFLYRAIQLQLKLQFQLRLDCITTHFMPFILSGNHIMSILLCAMCWLVADACTNLLCRSLVQLILMSAYVCFWCIELTHFFFSNNRFILLTGSYTTVQQQNHELAIHIVLHMRMVEIYSENITPILPLLSLSLSLPHHLLSMAWKMQGKKQTFNGFSTSLGYNPVLRAIEYFLIS